MIIYSLCSLKIDNSKRQSLERGTNIEQSDEFSTLGIPLGICMLIVDNVIVQNGAENLTNTEKGARGGSA